MAIIKKTIISLALVEYEVIIANSALRASLAICYLVSHSFFSWKVSTQFPCRTALGSREIITIKGFDILIDNVLVSIQ